MKKSVLFSLVTAGLCLMILVSLGFSDSKPAQQEFVPVEKGKTYNISTSYGQRFKITVLEEPKGNWVKVDIKGGGNFYLSLNNVALVSTE